MVPLERLNLYSSRYLRHNYLFTKIKMMKIFKFLTIITITGIIASCAGTSLNFISIDILNSKNEVTIGSDLKVKFHVMDEDGIDYINIDIPSLGISEVVEDYSAGNKWKFEKHYSTENATSDGSHQVNLTIVDMIGESYDANEGFELK